jgi:hypothetical protein
MPRRVLDECIRLRQRHLWRVIDNGFARPFLDRWGVFREDRTDGINYLRSLVGISQLLLPYRRGPLPEGLWSPRRLNVLIRDCHFRSYLEIGVFEAETFVNVIARRRCGVDPNPLFDAVLMPRGSSFAVSTSDDFFRNLRRSKRFNIAFLDGLHTFEQTYRDLINAFAHVTNGVILIDDTVPSDEYSAIPDRVASYRARDAAGLAGRPWHGDVWRVVMMLERHHPELEWRTIVDEGNPQTLVWRRRHGVTVMAAGAHEIALVSMPTYVEEFVDGVPNYFHPMTEALALAECVSSFRR